MIGVLRLRAQPFSQRTNCRPLGSNPKPRALAGAGGLVGEVGGKGCFPAQQTKSIWLSSCILSSWKLFNKTKSKPVGIDLFDFSCLFIHSSYMKTQGIIH